jgi:orotate phosphoribosyltransferase
MDQVLAQALIDLKVPQFGPSQKNKGDSPSCRFEPRNLLSSPPLLRHLGEKLAEIVRSRCSGQALVGMATSGIAWATLASLYSDLPMLYLRKALEPGVSERLLEGIPPSSGALVLVDDLIFDGHSKRQAILSLHKLGYRVSDVVVIIDRQLQRIMDGPPIEQAFDLRLHSLITMSDIVDYMLAQGALTSHQLEMLVRDYRHYRRWTLPRFAANR